jgi:hypothetical protein
MLYTPANENDILAHKIKQSYVSVPYWVFLAIHVAIDDIIQVTSHLPTPTLDLLNPYRIFILDQTFFIPDSYIQQE